MYDKKDEASKDIQLLLNKDGRKQRMINDCGSQISKNQ